jgi:hypothetical protein
MEREYAALEVRHDPSGRQGDWILDAWLRQDMDCRYGTTLQEKVPDELVSLVLHAVAPKQRRGLE